MQGDGGGCRVSANEYSCAHGAQINFVDLTPYLTLIGSFGVIFQLYAVVANTLLSAYIQLFDVIYEFKMLLTVT